MSWNGSDNKVKSNHSSTSDLQPSTSRKHGLLAGLIVVALGCVAVWCFIDKHSVFSISDYLEVATDKESPRMAEISSHISDVKDARATSRSQIANSITKETKNLTPSLVHTQTVNVVKFLYEPKIFASPAEDTLSALLTLRPGDMMVGFEPNDEFVEQLKNAMTNKIVISDDDPPEIIERKNAAIEGKKLLKEAMDRGESVKDILQKEYDTLIHWQEYRDELMKGLNEVMEKEDITPEDVDDYIKASNELMKKYGVDNPLPIPLELDLYYELKKEEKLEDRQNESH